MLNSRHLRSGSRRRRGYPPPGRCKAPAPASDTWPWPDCSAKVVSPARAADAVDPGPLAPKPPHFPAKAKRIIFLFMEGAMSPDGHLGVQAAAAAGRRQGRPRRRHPHGSKFKFRQYGQTGTWVSELFPHMARHVDKLCFLRGLHTDTPAHPQAVIQLHTGTRMRR